MRGSVETGAGASSQDVILAIGTAITNGVAGIVIKEIISWAKKRVDDRGNQASTHADHYLEKSMYEVIKHFKVQGELETVKVIKTASGSEAVFRDSQDNR